MATILSTNAQTIAGNILVTAPVTSPSASVVFATPGQLSYELLLTVPDVGSCAFVAELSRDSGTTWIMFAADGATGRVPIAGGSSSIRFFTRYPITSTGAYLLRARATDVVGTWRATARAELQ